MKFTAFFIVMVIVASVRAQICTYYPNTPDLIWNNNVKSQRIFIEDKTKGTRELAEALFFDTSGNCIKRVYRNYNTYPATLLFSEWSSPYKRDTTWNIFGFYDKDSNEVVSDKTFTYFDRSGRIIKMERTVFYNGKASTLITLFRVAQSGNTESSDTYRLNNSRDTIEHSFSVVNGFTTTRYEMEKKDRQWIERKKTITKKDGQGQQVLYESYSYGKLDEHKTWKYIREGANSIVFEYNEQDELVEKTIYEGNRGYTIYYYENGQEVNRYHEEFPYADPVPDYPDHEIKLDDEDRDNGWGNASKADSSKLKDTKVQASAPVPLREKPNVEPRIVNTYRNNDPSQEPVMVQYFGIDGLVIRQEVIWDNKTWHWVYEFY